MTAASEKQITRGGQLLRDYLENFTAIVVHLEQHFPAFVFHFAVILALEKLYQERGTSSIVPRTTRGRSPSFDYANSSHLCDGPLTPVLNSHSQRIT